MQVTELIGSIVSQFETAEISYGHGTDNAWDESVWLVLWSLGLDLSTSIDGMMEAVDEVQIAKIQAIVDERIKTRKPLAYIVKEAWLQGLPFYVDERVIVPRSFIAEILLNEAIDVWLKPGTEKILDLCTGNGSLAVIAATYFEDVRVVASDISPEALEVAHINVDKHYLQSAITLVESDGLASPELKKLGPFDLIICNPPYVTEKSMGHLPLEYLAEPSLALYGGVDGMDFVRALINDVPAHLSDGGVLILEIGNERENFEKTFPLLNPIWLATETTENAVLLLQKENLISV